MNRQNKSWCSFKLNTLFSTNPCVKTSMSKGDVILESGNLKTCYVVS